MKMMMLKEITLVQNPVIDFPHEASERIRGSERTCINCPSRVSMGTDIE